MKKYKYISSMIAAEAAYELDPSERMDKWVEYCLFDSKKYDKSTTLLRHRTDFRHFWCRMKKWLKALKSKVFG